MSLGLRRFVLPAVAVLTVAAVGSRTVLATPSTPVASTTTPQSVAPVSSGDRAVFVPVTQRRLLNTATSSRISPSSPRAVRVTGVAGVPSNALAVVLNVAAVKPARAGFLSVYPTGTTRPAGIATVSFVVGQVTENVATVKVGSGGQVSVFASYASHAIVDVAGYYVAHVHDDRYLVKAQAQARTAENAFLCPAGKLIQSVAADGAPTCVVDASGPISDIGAGLLLDNGVLSAAQSRTAANAFTCGLGQYLRAVAADGAPTCAADRDTDTDTDTQYEAGPGLTLEGTTFAADQRRDAKEAFTCSPGTYLRVVDADGAPTCDEDVDTDTDTTYTAGFGLVLEGTTFSAQQGRSGANAFTCPVGQYLRAADADGTPTCAPDTNTTYSAGHGLTLSGTTFSLAEGANVVRVRGDSVTAADNGARLRSVLATLPFVPTATRPILVVLSPGTYDIGTGTNMGVPAYVTLVGSGRDATVITGSFGAGSSGLLELGTGSTLASLSVKNSAGTNAAVAPIVVNGGTARLFDVAGTATGTAAGPTAFGLVVFSGANVVVEQSTFTASGPSSAYALYAVSATLRGINVTGTATSGTGAAYGVAGGSSSTVDLAGGWLTATSTAGGTPYVAGELGSFDVVRIANARLTGGTYGTPTCFGGYDASYAPRTC